MDEIITWININAAGVAALAAGATALAAIALVWVTTRYVKLTRDISEAARDSTDTARVSADAAKQSARHAEHAAHTAERALLANTMPLLVTDFGAGTGRRDVAVHNVGSSSALNAVLHYAGRQQPLGRVDALPLVARKFNLPDEEYLDLNELNDENGVAVLKLDYEDAIGNQYHTVCKHHHDPRVPHYETFLRYGDELQSLTSIVR